MHSKTLVFKLLGTPELIWFGSPITLHRRQARALLYRLAVELQPVSRDALLLLFWPDSPDSTARRNLTRLLSYLRSALPDPSLLQANPSTIFLNPDLTISDTVEFARLSVQRDEAAWETAVTLVRGPFLEGFALPGSSEFDSWLSIMQQQIEQHVLELLSRLVEAKTAVADYASAIRFARHYLEIDDLAEDIQRQLISLYAANGQRSEALRQYEQCIVVLERELGVEPLPETRTAYEAARGIVQPQKTPAVSQPVWSTLPGLDLPLLGREEVWKEMSRAYDRFRSGGVILLSGSAGVGKSRLMQEFAMAYKGLILIGNAHAEGQTLPYQPLVQALRQALPLVERWSSAKAVWLAEVSRLLPELRDYFSDLPQLVDVDAQQAQARLFEGLTRVFRSLAVESPLLLCIDDVHWADASTLGWLQYIGDRLAESRICIMATLRTSEGGVLRSWRRTAARTGHLTELRLEGLTAADIEGLLGETKAQIRNKQELASSIFEATGGNTFFVLETIRELLETKQISEPPAELPLPATVRDAVLRRTGRLMPLAKQILEVSAVLTPILSVDVLSKTAGRDEMDTAVCIEELVAHHLLSDGDQLRFQHALARDAVYQNLSAWRRQLLHRRAARTLAELPRYKDRSLAVIARHYAAAGDFEPAITYYQQAAEEARSVYAYQEAINYLQHAIDLAFEVGEKNPVLAWLQEAQADILTITGQFSAAEELYRSVMAQSVESDPLKLAVAEAKLAATLPPQEREDEAEQVYLTALARLDNPSSPVEYHPWQSARLNIILGLLDALYFQLRPGVMGEWNEKAGLLLDEVGTAEQKASYYIHLNQQSYLKHRYRLPEENIALSVKALTYAYESGNARLIARQQFHHGFVSLWHGSLDEAEALLSNAMQSAEEMGDFWLNNQAVVYLSITYRFQGSASKVAHLLPELIAISQQVGNSMYISVGQANRAWLKFVAGEFGTAQVQAAKAVEGWAKTPYPFQWLAYWVLLAVAMRQNRVIDAIDAARAILDPKQQRMPDEVEKVLETAVAAWDSNEENAARDQLETAVKLAAQHGYL